MPVSRVKMNHKKALPVAAAMALGIATIAGGSASASTRVSTAAAMPKPPSGKVSLTEAGSTLLEPLFGIWAAAYHKDYSNITISPSGGGSGTGISDAAAGTVDIGASDAYLSGTDRAQNPGLQNIALAISAQMINYNVEGLSASVHLKLSGKVLSDIYQGKISNWDDPAIKKLNPGVKLPNEKIVALHRSDSSGDTFLFTTYLSDADPSGWGRSIGYGTTVSFPSAGATLGETGNSGMVSGCKSTPGCIAYIGISYRSDTTAAHLGEAELGNRKGKFELPTASTIGAEASSFTSKTPADESISLIYGPAPTGYPIINYEYAIVGTKQSPQPAAATKAFLDWAIAKSGGNASMYLSQVNFQPLPAGVAALSGKLISKIK